MPEIIKVKSTLNYAIGTMVQDRDTGEVFKVLKIDRIAVLDKLKYDLTLKLISKENKQ